MKNFSVTIDFVFEDDYIWQDVNERLTKAMLHKEMPIGRAHIRFVDAKKEISCASCQRLNNIGVSVCWGCGNLL